MILLAVSVQADLVIDVDITGCQTGMPITQGVAQTFKVSSLYELQKVEIWIQPELEYTTSYNVEIWTNATLLSLGSSDTLSLASSTAGTASTWYAFFFPAGPVVLKPEHAYWLKLVRLSQYSGGFSYCNDVYSDGSLFVSMTDPFPLNDMSFRLYAAPLQLAHWTFNGDFDDASPAKLAAAVPMGSNVALLGDYVSIRLPGYLNLPSVDIQNTSFTVAFNMRVPTSMTAGKSYLYADWSPGQWQFLSQIDAAHTISVQLRRNIETNGANPEQDLVAVTSSIPVPLGEWFDVAWAFDRPARTLTLYFNQQSVGSATVRCSVLDLSLKTSNSTYYQFGRKGDEATHLDADLRHLRVYATPDVNLTSL